LVRATLMNVRRGSALSRAAGARDGDVAEQAVIDEAQGSDAAGDLVGERLFDEPHAEAGAALGADRRAVVLGPADEQARAAAVVAPREMGGPPLPGGKRAVLDGVGRELVQRHAEDADQLRPDEAAAAVDRDAAGVMAIGANDELDQLGEHHALPAPRRQSAVDAGQRV